MPHSQNQTVRNFQYSTRRWWSNKREPSLPYTHTHTRRQTPQQNIRFHLHDGLDVGSLLAARHSGTDEELHKSLDALWRLSSRHGSQIRGREVGIPPEAFPVVGFQVEQNLQQAQMMQEAGDVVVAGDRITSKSMCDSSGDYLPPPPPAAPDELPVTQVCPTCVNFDLQAMAAKVVRHARTKFAASEEQYVCTSNFAFVLELRPGRTQTVEVGVPGVGHVTTS